MPLLFHSPASENFLTDFIENILTPEQQQNLNSSSSNVTSGTKKNVRKLQPKLDVLETEREYVVQVDLPGMQKNEIELSMSDNNILIIKGERKSHLERKETDQDHLGERSFGVFERRLQLPKNVNFEDVEATLELGVLTLKYVKKPKVDATKKILIR
ncbi:Heat shock protein HSP 90-beta [Lobulomyces angularis]|nr:Heat shock protein HSP 90-beta [Lobulomyces angularis]